MGGRAAGRWASACYAAVSFCCWRDRAACPPCSCLHVLSACNKLGCHGHAASRDATSPAAGWPPRAASSVISRPPSAGMVHLDQLPSAASRPYSEAEAQQERQAGSGQQWQQQQQGPSEPALPLAWLGGLLFGRRRGEAAGGAQPKPLDPATWREFEKDFTEV